MAETEHMVIKTQAMRLGDGGRVVIPKEFRKALGMAPGKRIVMQLGEGELRILTVKEGIRRAQETAREHPAPDGDSVVDALIAERREGSASE